MLFDGCMYLLTKDLERVLCKSDQELLFVTKMEIKRQSKHSTGRCSKHDSGERCHEEAHMHQDPSGMLARIPFGLTTGPIEGAEILVAGCRKETVASEMRSNVLKYRDTLFMVRSRFDFLLQ